MLNFYRIAVFLFIFPLTSQSTPPQWASHRTGEEVLLENTYAAEKTPSSQKNKAENSPSPNAVGLEGLEEDPEEEETSRESLSLEDPYAAELKTLEDDEDNEEVDEAEANDDLSALDDTFQDSNEERDSLAEFSLSKDKISEEKEDLKTQNDAESSDETDPEHLEDITAPTENEDSDGLEDANEKDIDQEQSLDQEDVE